MDSATLTIDCVDDKSDGSLDMLSNTRMRESSQLGALVLKKALEDINDDLLKLKIPRTILCFHKNLFWEYFKAAYTTYTTYTTKTSS